MKKVAETIEVDQPSEPEPRAHGILLRQFCEEWEQLLVYGGGEELSEQVTERLSAVLLLLEVVVVEGTPSEVEDAAIAAMQVLRSAVVAIGRRHESENAIAAKPKASKVIDMWAWRKERQ